jgi:hypothetical protein
MRLADPAGRHHFGTTVGTYLALTKYTWMTAICPRSIDAFYTLGGGAALYDSSPLQRRLRDMHVATQHVQVQLRNYENGWPVVASANERSEPSSRLRTACSATVTQRENECVIRRILSKRRLRARQSFATGYCDAAATIRRDSLF